MSLTLTIFTEDGRELCQQFRFKGDASAYAYVIVRDRKGIIWDENDGSVTYYPVERIKKVTIIEHQ